MDYEQILKEGRSMGYHWSQTERGRRKLEAFFKIYEERQLIVQGIQEGIQLAEWEKKHKPKTMETVDKNYKDQFNLSYLLVREGRLDEYNTLINLFENNPQFKGSKEHQALEAGRKQAEKDIDRQFDEMIRDEKVEEHASNKAGMTEDKRSKEQKTTQQKEDQGKSPQMPQPELSPEQKKEVEAFEKAEAQRHLNENYKAGTERINATLRNNAQEERNEQYKNQQEKQPQQPEKQSLKDKFLNRGKDKDKDRQRD